MRLFIAVNFDDEIKSRLLQMQGWIKARSIKGNFSRPENFHLTIVFIGNAIAELVPVIKTILERSCQPPHGAFTVEFTHTGFFKHSGKELWWIGADPNAANFCSLVELQGRLAGALEAAGIPFDKRPFRAHITLGREIKHVLPIELPAETITVPVRKISLMKSEHVHGVLTYTELAACCLA